jgi:hypothetical protein
VGSREGGLQDWYLTAKGMVLISERDVGRVNLLSWSSLSSHMIRILRCIIEGTSQPKLVFEGRRKVPEGRMSATPNQTLKPVLLAPHGSKSLSVVTSPGFS